MSNLITQLKEEVVDLRRANAKYDIAYDERNDNWDGWVSQESKLRGDIVIQERNIINIAKRITDCA